MLRHIHQLLGRRDLSLLGLESERRGDAPPLRALYAGSGSNLEFLRALFSLDGPPRTLESLTNPLALHRAISGIPADTSLVLTDLPPLWSAAVKTRADIVIPAWVRQELTFESSELLPRSVRREAARHARRHGYVADFTTEREAFRHFYRELYRPYVTARFGSQAIVVDADSFMAQTEDRLLARLHAAGNCVAGLVLTVGSDTLRFGWFGARTNPPPRGASEVLDAACVHEAARLHMHRIVLGNSRPCLSDGVLRYKARLGARIIGTRFPQDMLAVSICGDAPAAWEALERNPLLAIRRGRPYVYRVRRGPAGPSLRLAPLT
jgi:hypothetical protein